MSQNFGSPREQHETGGLQVRSLVAAWFVVGLVIVASAGLMVARTAADTAADGTHVVNPLHNSQCPPLSNAAAGAGKCPSEDAAGELQTFIMP